MTSENAHHGADYWPGQQRRISQPMFLRRGATHYAPIAWDDATALIADRLNALAEWSTTSGKANFTCHEIPHTQLESDQLVMMSVRRQDQFNTRIYGSRLLPWHPQRAPTYFPDTNVLVPLNSVAERSNTPTSKYVVINVPSENVKPFDNDRADTAQVNRG